MTLRIAMVPALALLALGLAACGGGGTGAGGSGAAQRSAAAHRASQASLRWTRCPTGNIGPTSAGGWGASVAGISCRAAGPIIAHHIVRYPPGPRAGTSAAAIWRSNPSSFHSVGYTCTAFPLPDGGGWHVLCDDGARHISMFFTP